MLIHLGDPFAGNAGIRNDAVKVLHPGVGQQAGDAELVSRHHQDGFSGMGDGCFLDFIFQRDGIGDAPLGNAGRGHKGDVGVEVAQESSGV